MSQEADANAGLNGRRQDRNEVFETGRQDRRSPHRPKWRPYLLHSNKMATEYTRAYNNLDYDIETNGESYVLDCLARTHVRTVFDVGANVGVYTRACLSRFKEAEIHAFEIAPPTYEKLAHNLASSRVRLNNFGLSNSGGTIDLHYCRDDDGKSSLIGGGDIINEASFRTVTANVTTGDKYCRDNSIPSIDLLKVDLITRVYPLFRHERLILLLGLTVGGGAEWRVTRCSSRRG